MNKLNVEITISEQKNRTFTPKDECFNCIYYCPTCNCCNFSSAPYCTDSDDENPFEDELEAFFQAITEEQREAISRVVLQFFAER